MTCVPHRQHLFILPLCSLCQHLFIPAACYPYHLIAFLSPFHHTSLPSPYRVSPHASISSSCLSSPASISSSCLLFLLFDRYSASLSPHLIYESIAFVPLPSSSSSCLSTLCRRLFIPAARYPYLIASLSDCHHAPPLLNIQSVPVACALSIAAARLLSGV